MVNWCWWKCPQCGQVLFTNELEETRYCECGSCAVTVDGEHINTMGVLDIQWSAGHAKKMGL